MRTTNPPRTTRAQLPLIDLPAATKPRDDGVRRRAAAAITARHCDALLAELDRVALEQERRARHLADLFHAAERADSERAASGRDAPALDLRAERRVGAGR